MRSRASASRCPPQRKRMASSTSASTASTASVPPSERARARCSDASSCRWRPNAVRAAARAARARSPACGWLRLTSIHRSSASVSSPRSDAMAAMRPCRASVLSAPGSISSAMAASRRVPSGPISRRCGDSTIRSARSPRGKPPARRCSSAAASVGRSALPAPSRCAARRLCVCRRCSSGTCEVAACLMRSCPTVTISPVSATTPRLTRCRTASSSRRSSHSRTVAASKAGSGLPARTSVVIRTAASGGAPRSRLATTRPGSCSSPPARALIQNGEPAARS